MRVYINMYILCTIYNKKREWFQWAPMNKGNKEYNNDSPLV